MKEKQISIKAARQTPDDELMRQLNTSRRGLSRKEALERLDRFGANEIASKNTNPIVQFLGYLWGPIPWMIETAAALSLVVRHWVDFAVILTLLLFNAAVGFWQEHQAGNAVAALRDKLALKCRVRRDGAWQGMDARELVPGDVIRLRAGDIVPADAKLVEGDYLGVDQSALTGESLPAGKEIGDGVYSGSVARKGEMVALVVATGAQTYFGRTASLVAGSGKASHFQKAVLRIGDYLIGLSLALVAVLVVVQLFRGSSLAELLQFALILTVASIPVAMPAVLSVTMAVGAMALSKMKAIVSRLESVEEMAGMDVLCSDKTGTLTQNRLTVGEVKTFDGVDAAELLLMAALASKAENDDSIDTAVIEALEDSGSRNDFETLDFTPFDPVGKRTEATVRGRDGGRFKVAKGAPQVIMDLADLDPPGRRKVGAVIDELAGRGQRTLGVACRVPSDGRWRFLGVVPLFDPPREDAAETIAQAASHGIDVKMVTGDNLAIAREMAGKLGLGKAVYDVDRLSGGETSEDGGDMAARIEAADGFAQVFPEHKHRIVKALQDRGHIVAMTGDGVNDAPALKQADVGIAVNGATDAARAAADLVLTAPGLSVLVRAVEEARRIFERMNSYAVYRITETIRIMIFVVLAMIVFDFYPITAIMIILLAFLNDVPIMTIAYDHTGLEPGPVRWNMHRIVVVAAIMGLIGVVGSFLMLYIALDVLHLGIPQVQTYIFLKMAVSGHLTLFVARSKGFFLKKPRPAAAMVWSGLATKALGTILAAWGFGLITPISWREINLIWGYSILWAFLTDGAKILVCRHFELDGRHHARFLETVHDHLTPQSAQGGTHA